MNPTRPAPTLPEPPRMPLPASTEPRRIDSRELVGREGLVEIDHAGAIYRLRVTSLGKLILTK